MKVLALAHQYVPIRNAGAETMLHGMLSALARAGHDVHASLSMQVGDPYTHEGVKVWPRQGIKAEHFPHLPDAAVLVAHLDNSEVAAYIGHLNELPVVLVHHNTFEGARTMLHFYGARVDLIVANSKWMDADLASWHLERDLPCPRTIIVRPLVGPEFTPVAGPHDRVTQINMKRLAPASLAAGSLLSKGGETFWAVAERMPKTQFLGVVGAYGTQQEGDLPNVEVIDHVPSVEMRERVYARTRVLLVPSNYESWGRVATEAIACGIPVVCSPTLGLVENLGDAGIYVDWQDVDGYVRALRTLALPGPYAAAKARALARAAEHQRMRVEDEARWVQAVEVLGAHQRAHSVPI